MSDTSTPAPSGALARNRSGITQTTSQEALRLQELSLNSRILATVNPWMGSRPDVLLELAGSGLPPDQLATQGAALYGMQNMSGLRDSLTNLTPVAQRSIWSKLTDTQQRALDQMGYKTPDKSGGQNSLLSAAGKVVEPVWSGVNTVGGPAIGGALDVLTWIGDQPAHLYRTIRTMDDWQQWAALAGGAAALALAPATFGGSLAAAGTLMSAGMLGGAALGGATLAAAATNPAEWWDALNATWDGERVFERGAQRQARELLQSDELTMMAKEIALEIDPYELATTIAGERGGSQQQLLSALERTAAGMADPGSPEYQQIYNGLLTLVNQEPFMAAIDTLQQGKISVGRDVADFAGLDGTAHLLVSGAIDGLWIVSMDPTLAAGSLVRWNKVRRFGITGDSGAAFTERLTHLYNTSGATRANIDSMVAGVNAGDFTMFPREARGLWNPLHEYARQINKVDDVGRVVDFAAEDYFSFIELGGGMQRLLEGKATIRGVEQAVVATRSESRGWGRFVREARQFANAMDDATLEHSLRSLADDLDVADDLERFMPSNVLDDALHTNIVPVDDVADRAAGELGYTLGRPLGVRPIGNTVGSFIQEITTMAPPNKAMRIVGEGAEEDIPKMVELVGRAMNLPSKVRDSWLNAIMVQGSAGQRIAVVESFMDTAFTAAGMKSNTELAALSDKYLRKMTQAYGLGGLDNAALAGIPVKTGIYPEAHQASLVVMPNMQEMLSAVRRGEILKNIAKVTDSNFVEASMSRFWKPGVLLRIGFIPRAAGEEGLAWMARMTQGGVAQEYGARTIAMRSAYDDAIKAQRNFIPLTKAQQAALDWKVPTHVKPLVRMASRVGWGDPVETMFDAYGHALRGFLADGVGYKIDDVVTAPGLGGIGTRSAQWHHGLIYGRENSWRRLVANGVDPDLRKAGETWVEKHADAVMRGTSSMNSSVFEKSIVNPDVDYFMVDDPKNPGKLIAEPRITLRGERERVGMGDRERYAGAVHHRLAEAFDDEIVGPVLTRMYAHYFPGFDDLQFSNVVEAVELSRTAKSWEARMLLSEGLDSRHDNWRATADIFRRHDTNISDVLDDALVHGDVQWNQILEGLDRKINEVLDQPDQVAKLQDLKEELAGVQDLIAGMESLSPASRAWMAQSLSADISQRGNFYDIDSMRAFRDGATGTVTKRPERVWYRGIKDTDTVELRPAVNGGYDLVFKPQHQGGWGASVVSLSTMPDQSLSYAMADEIYNLNSGTQPFARGAMVEVDGDYVLNHFGTTMDDVNARPVQNFNKNGDVGVHYVNEGVDKGEISVVTQFGEAAGPRLDRAKWTQAHFREIADRDLVEAADDLTVFNQIIDPGENELMFSAINEVISGNTVAPEDVRAILAIHDQKVQDFSLLTGPTRASDELVIPAGSWSIQSQDDMERLITQMGDTIDPRFKWIQNTKFRSEGGATVEQINTKISTEFNRIIADLTPNQFGGYDVDADALDALAEFLDGLPDDEFDIFQGVMGWRINSPRGDMARETELRRMAQTMFQSPDSSLTRFQSAIDIRGAGGFEQTIPKWTPFHTDRESFERALEAEIYAQLLRPENAEHVRKSRFAMQTADGREVAQPMQEGVQRVFTPILGQNPRLDKIITEGMSQQFTDDELVGFIVGRLLGETDAFRTHPDFVNRLAADVQERAVADAVIAYLERADARAGAWTAPMYGVAYDDPRMAQWVSDLVTGNPVKAPTGVGYMDIPRKGVTGQNDQGVQLANEFGDGGRSWRFDESRDAGISMIGHDGLVQLPDGSHTAGAAYTEAIGDYAKTIRRKVMTEHSVGVRERYAARNVGDELEPATNLFRNIGDAPVPVKVGERFGGPEELFDDAGNPVNFADERFFDLSVDHGDDMLWPIIGPMARDHHEQRGGLTRIVTRDTKTRVGGYRAGEQIDPANNWVQMTRSRVDDIYKTRELDLPNVALAEVRVPTNDTTWDRIVRHGFDKVIAPAIDALVRTPMSFHYYAQAYKQNRQFLGWMLDDNLFKTQIPRAFADQLSLLDDSVDLNPDRITDIRRLADEFVDARPGSDDEAIRWFTSLGVDDEHVVGELTKMQGAARRMGNPDLAEAAGRLMEIDTEPFRLVGLAGDGPSSQRLVAAYHDRVPEEIWSKGQEAVNRHLRDAQIGLPQLVTNDQWTIMKAARNNYAHVDSTIGETATLRALENVIPFLDSHELRTQFASTTKNLLPFWYAEENFLKRWARVMGNDGTIGLATIRKAQLAYMGIRSAGIIRTDTNGKDWFVYPGSGLLGEALSKLPFIPDTLPLGVMFQSSTDSMLPGVNDRFGTPSVSPFVALPIDVTTKLFPDSVPIKRALLGDIGSSKAALNQFVPTTVQRFWEAAFGDEESSRRYAAAMMSAAAMMEAEGNGLEDSAPPEAVELYLDRLRNHARIVMWAQAITGFVVPGSPVAVNTGEDVGSFGWMTGLGIENPDELVSVQYRAYITNLGIDEGTSAFLRDFPNSDLEDVINPLAFVVSTSSSASGAPLPATRTGLAWYERNAEWIDSMPEAGAWFLPPDPEGDFDYYSYNQQLVSGLRKQRNPEEFIRALKYRNGAGTYFDARDQYESAAASFGNDQARKNMLDDAWDTWRTTWLASHPVFAEELVSGDARQRRARTIDQLRYAVTDPGAPSSPHLTAIAEMSETFDLYTTTLLQWNESRSAESRRRVSELKAAFEQWSTAWVLRNPDLEQMWSAVFRPEASL